MGVRGMIGSLFGDGDGDDSESGEGVDSEGEPAGETRPYSASVLEDLPDEWVAEYEPGGDGRTTDSLRSLHKDFVAPSEVDFGHRDVARLGDKWTQSLFINDWPQNAQPGFLELLFTDSMYDTDVSIHVEPHDTEQAVADLKDNLSEIQVKLKEQEEAGSPAVRDTRFDLEDAQAMYDLVNRSGAKMVDTSMYITHRARSREAVEDNASDVFSLLKTPPANTDPRVATRNQDRAARSVSPIGMDDYGKRTSMMGGAVGAMMPFSSATLIEEDGVDWGVMPYNGSPVIVDRFGRDTGYNVLVIGNIGSGKSFSTKLNLIRTLLRRSDVDLVMLDPLEGFVGVTQALRGNRVRVGGDVGLNPLEIKETPPEILSRKDADIDPYGSKIKDVMSFFETFFAIRNFDFGQYRGVLELAVKESYRRKGIDRDPATHGKESPVMGDVLDVLGEMSRDADSFTQSGSVSEREEMQNGASKLLVAMQPFDEGGEFANLSRQTEIDISESRVTYLDLQEQEGRGGMGLMMQLLFNAVYERAKQTDNKTIFVIDEARYIMKDSASLEFLEQAVRHSRHYEMSIQFVTQTIDEFFAREEAEAIADNCSIKQLNRVEGLDEEIGVNKLGLNEEQIRFAQMATPGDKERDYSEALLGVQGEGWRPIHVRASEQEAAVVDFEPGGEGALPGPTAVDSAQTARIERRLSAAIEAEENVIEAGTDEVRSFADKVQGLAATEGDEQPEEDVAADAGGSGEERTASEAPSAGGGSTTGETAAVRNGERGDGSAADPSVLEGVAAGEQVPPGTGSTQRGGEGDATESESTAPNASSDGHAGGKSSGDIGEDDADVSTDMVSEGGRNAHYMQVVVDPERESESERGVLDALETAVEVLGTDPSADDIHRGDFTIGFDAIVVSSITDEEVQHALSDLERVSTVEVSTIRNAHECEGYAERIENVSPEQIVERIDAHVQGDGTQLFGTGRRDFDADDLADISFGEGEDVSFEDLTDHGDAGTTDVATEGDGGTETDEDSREG